MEKRLQGKRVAILATDGFEQSELVEPRRALEEAGSQTTIVSLKAGSIKGWSEEDWGDSINVDEVAADCESSAFDALLLPGGVMNPDKLRMDKDAVRFCREFFEQGKPVAAICHGPWLLVEADMVQNRRVTSWPSLRTDLENAGARWENSECVVDDGLVTSRNPGDIPAFSSKMIEEIAEGKHAHQNGKASVK